MSTYSKTLLENLSRAIENKRKLQADNHQLNQFDKMTAKILETYKRGGRLYIAGNGGSAADIQFRMSRP